MRAFVLAFLIAAVLPAGVAAALAVPPTAPDPAAAPADAAGDWRLSEVGGKIACTLTFTRQTSAGGFEVKTPQACRLAFPPLQTLTAWSEDDKGAIVLTDAQAKPIVVFPEAADGSYEAKAPDGKTWRLDPVKPAPAGLRDLTFRPAEVWR